MPIKEEREVKWGEIYYCDFGKSKGSVQAKLRPVLIIQNNVGNENGPTTVVAAISSVIKKMYMPTHIVLDKTCGLKEKSIVMLEQIRTVDKATELKECIGKIQDTETKEAIKRGLAIELGVIEIPKKNTQRITLTLCPKCRKDFLCNPGYLLRRKHKYQEPKDQCDVCRLSSGFDYIVQKK